MLDPIDGTRGFLGLRQYAVCLGLLDTGRVVLGVLGCPNLPQAPFTDQVGFRESQRVQATIAHSGCGLCSTQRPYPGLQGHQKGSNLVYPITCLNVLNPLQVCLHACLHARERAQVTVRACVSLCLCLSVCS